MIPAIVTLIVGVAIVIVSFFLTDGPKENTENSVMDESRENLEKKLDELVAKYDCLTARRGMGLMQGVECSLPVGKVSAEALNQGLIVITAGSNVLRFVPPLVIEKSDVDEMIEKLETTLVILSKSLYNKEDIDFSFEIMILIKGDHMKKIILMKKLIGK